MARRRTLLAALPAWPLAATLSGCGFHLRQTPAMPFSRIALAGFGPRSPLAAELRARLAETTRVVDVPGQAEVVLHALADRRERSVVATTSVGQVRELQLRVRLVFRVATPGDRELIPPTELSVARDLSTNETLALGKAQEEEEMYAAMQSDIVQQVLSRLVSADPARRAPGSAPASTPASASAPAADPASAPAPAASR